MVFLALRVGDTCVCYITCHCRFKFIRANVSIIFYILRVLWKIVMFLFTVGAWPSLRDIRINLEKILRSPFGPPRFLGLAGQLISGSTACVPWYVQEQGSQRSASSEEWDIVWWRCTANKCFFIFQQAILRILWSCKINQTIEKVIHFCKKNWNAWDHLGHIQWNDLYQCLELYTVTFCSPTHRSHHSLKVELSDICLGVMQPIHPLTTHSTELQSLVCIWIRRGYTSCKTNTWFSMVLDKKQLSLHPV